MNYSKKVMEGSFSDATEREVPWIVLLILSRCGVYLQSFIYLISTANDKITFSEMINIYITFTSK
jgi:hypothetical protein